MKDYYDRRAPEYDDTIGLNQEQALEAARLDRAVAALPPGRVLDVACGTGLLTQHLRGEVVALDASARMLDMTRARLPTVRLVRAEVPPLPFADRSFDRVFTSHFYSHLDRRQDRAALVAEARRVAPELVVVEVRSRGDQPTEGWEERPVHADGSTHLVFKRYFTPDSLLEELGGGEVVFAGRLLLAVAVRS